MGAIVLTIVANPISLIFALTLPGLIVPLLVYAAVSIALWVGSSAAFRAGRTTLAFVLAAPQALVALGGVGYFVLTVLGVRG